MTIDTIFLCFCEDCEVNDGIVRPYYMSRSLMQFVQDSKKTLKIELPPTTTQTAANSKKAQMYVNQV